MISTNRNCAISLVQHLESVWNAMGEREFEYVTVDSASRDGSWELFRKWRLHHANLRAYRRDCSRGAGRDLAVDKASGDTLLVVDTDTIYEPWLGRFVDRASERFAGLAVQAIYSGVYPRKVWADAGGQQPMDVAEDFDLWMRLHRRGLIRFYPAVTGKNTMHWADDSDFVGERFLSRGQRLKRVWRKELGAWVTRTHNGTNVQDVWKMNTVNLDLAPLETRWFGESTAASMPSRIKEAVRKSFCIVCR